MTTNHCSVLSTLRIQIYPADVEPPTRRKYYRRPVPRLMWIYTVWSSSSNGVRSVRRTTGGGAELSDPISYHHRDHYDPHHHYHHHHHHHRHPQECLQPAVSVSPDSSINCCSLSASNLSCHRETKIKCHDGTANKSIHFLAFSYRLLYIFYDVRVVGPDIGSVCRNE